MSRFLVKNIWEECYGRAEEVYDYAGRRMLKSACGNSHSDFEPTIDHIRPLSNGGKNKKQNIVICHRETNEEKAHRFPHWKANGKRFKAIKCKGNQNDADYKIVEDI